MSHDGATPPPSPWGPPPNSPAPHHGQPAQTPPSGNWAGGGFPPGYGAIALTLQGNQVTTSLVVPKVTFNGYPIPANFGLNTIPVPAGRHTVALSTQWLRTYGQAELDVDVAAGQTVPVFYATPYHQFTRGAIGYEKQKRPGLGVLIAMLLVIFAPLILCSVGAMFL
ncbi:hypothetical protein [Janibacter sp. GXQ6167]|uniref:hypothetical protein n=1 Tax=Janibacter sp. GXQ6167 TaxID=3240791 RepID=UPI0035235186